jgi:phosphatidyl-myo-inositol alpha-mannosyltransferase
MRIVLTHAYGWPEVRRGAERYVHELSAALVRSGHSVEVVMTAERPGRDIVLGVPVVRLQRRHHLTSRYGDLADQVEFGAQAFARLIGRRADVWHAVSTGDGAAASLAARLRPGLRSVYTEAGFPSRQSRERRRDHRYYQQIVRHIDEFVCLSEPAARMLNDDYGRAGRVVPGGVDTTVFSPGGARHPSPLLLFPSALGESRKNVTLVLEAVARLRERGQPVELWLVGPGELPPDLSPLAQDGLAAVTMHRVAESSEVPELYRRAWVTVLPSHAEVFGLVVLESMACGTPAVVLDDGLGPAELVVPGAGVRTEPTPDALADACALAIEMSRSAETVERCRDRAMDFDWDRSVVPQLMAAYSGPSRG